MMVWTVSMCLYVHVEDGKAVREMVKEGAV